MFRKTCQQNMHSISFTLLYLMALFHLLRKIKNPNRLLITYLKFLLIIVCPIFYKMCFPERYCIFWKSLTTLIQVNWFPSNPDPTHRSSLKDNFNLIIDKLPINSEIIRFNDKSVVIRICVIIFFQHHFRF